MPKGAGNKGKGKCLVFARQALAHAGDECLIWPFSRGAYGYGTLNDNGRHYYAHRWICEQIHGPAPTPEHQGAHSCGNGHGGCVNPNHISWKTPSENAYDKTIHGTAYSSKGLRRQKLTQEQVDEIRLVKTVAEQFAIAKRFGISDSTVRNVLYGKTWKGKKRFNQFSDEDIRRIRSLRGVMAAKDVAAEYKVTRNVIYHIWNRKFWRHVTDAPQVSEQLSQ